MQRIHTNTQPVLSFPKRVLSVRLSSESIQLVGLGVCFLHIEQYGRLDIRNLILMQKLFRFHSISLLPGLCMHAVLIKSMFHGAWMDKKDAL